VLAAAPQDGRAKLWIAWRLLALRRERPALFRDGDYTALKVSGVHAEHVVAFARHCDGTTLLVIAGRLFVRLMGESTDLPLGDLVWADTAVSTDLPDGMRLTNVLSGETLTVENGRISLCAAFSRLPAAVFLALT
jgi:(1->4)-alpha-D-glucan 1-alpha-D-glucosylmutase